MKVAEAEALGIDTTRQFITEFEGYRNQLVKPYMVDQNAEEQLAREAYDRLLEEVEASHILFRVDPSATLEEKRSAYEKALKVREEAIKGTDFSELARRYSEDQSSSEKGGLLPLLTTGQILPSFEKAAFALNEIGEVSKPVRTEFGWHIIKLLGERTPGSYEQMHDVIVHRMARDERADAGRKMFVEKLKEDKYFAWDESVRAMLEKEISNGGLEAVVGGDCVRCGLAMPRKQEIFACLNRYRG